MRLSHSFEDAKNRYNLINANNKSIYKIFYVLSNVMHIAILSDLCYQPIVPLKKLKPRVKSLAHIWRDPYFSRTLVFDLNFAPGTHLLGRFLNV